MLRGAKTANRVLVVFISLVAISALLAIDFGGDWVMATPSCRTNPAVPASLWILGVGPLAFYLPVCGNVMVPITDPTCLLVAIAMLAPLALVPRYRPKATEGALIFIALAWLSAGLLALMAVSQG